jgi:hypothetical protein
MENTLFQSWPQEMLRDVVGASADRKPECSKDVTLVYFQNHSSTIHQTK